MQTVVDGQKTEFCCVVVSRRHPATVNNVGFVQIATLRRKKVNMKTLKGKILQKHL